MSWLGTYKFRRKITVDNTNVDSDLTHFPVPIVLGTSVGQSSQDVSDIFDEVGASYLKIAITKADGTTQIYGDVEVWDNVNEKAVIHVAKADLVITTAAVTELYIYYDSSQGDNTTYIGLSGGTAAQSVWDSNFKAVYHMAQDPSGGAGCILDSTSNNNDGTPAGTMLSGDLVDGIIGKAIDFDSSDDCINIEDSVSLDVSQSLTIYAIINLVGQQGIVISKRNTDPGSDYSFEIQAGTTLTDKVSVRINDNANTAVSSSDLVRNIWNGIGLVYDKTNISCYINGSVNSTHAYTADIEQNNTPVAIGRRFHTGAETFFSGKIGHIQISDIARSADWIKATNYALTDDLIVFGVPELLINHPETTISTSVLSDLQINIAAPELSVPIVATNPTIFTGVFVSTPEITIPIIPGAPNININIASDEIIISSTATSNLSIDIVTAEVISEIVVAEPNLFIGLFIESPEIIIPATADSNVSIIIVPAEAKIIPVITSTIFNINIASMASTVTRYLLTITGTADSLEDFELPMSSFQARRKSGEATYLSVVIPTMDYAAEIAARSNGTIKVEQAYTLNDEYVQRELILEADIDNIQTHQGGRNQSVVLEGYKTTTYVPKSMTLTTSTYRALSGGKLRYRVAKPNVFLNPGDTVTIGDDTFIIGTMAYAISPTMQQIELEEA